MKTLSIIALTASLVAANLAMPAFAATSLTGSTPTTAPWCSSTASDEDFTRQTSILSDELQLDTKQGVSIDKSNGCIAVSSISDGKATVSFYDPDTLKLLATI